MRPGHQQAGQNAGRQKLWQAGPRGCLQADSCCWCLECSTCRRVVCMIDTGAVRPLFLKRPQCNLAALIIMESQGSPVPRPEAGQPLQQQNPMAVHKTLLAVCLSWGRSNVSGRQVTCPQRGHCSLMRHSASSLSSSGTWPLCSSAEPWRRVDLRLISAGCKGFGLCFLGGGGLHCRYGAEWLILGGCTRTGKHVMGEKFSLCFGLGRAVQG